jgi:hypothetical protein
MPFKKGKRGKEDWGKEDESGESQELRVQGREPQ